MRIAVIGDIHSNQYALTAVLDHIKGQHVDAIFSTGDLVGYLPHPNEVIELMQKHQVQVLKGNHDDVIAESSSVSIEELKTYSLDKIQANASRIYTNHVITDENRQYLKHLPDSIVFEVSGKKVMLVHGSHRHIAEYLYEDETLLTEISQTLDADVLISGHTHMPYHVMVANKHFMNVGSVGKPKTGCAEGTYLVVEITENDVKSECMSVVYDLASLIKDIQANEMISNQLIHNLSEGI